MPAKKQMILWVLNILNRESDESRPITQTKIANIISMEKAPFYGAFFVRYPTFACGEIGGAHRAAYKRA